MPLHPEIPNVSTYINIENAMLGIRKEFNAWYDNSLLYDYLSQLSHALENHPVSMINAPALKQHNSAVGVTSSGFVSEAE